MRQINVQYEEEIRSIIERNPKNFIKVLKSKGSEGRYENRTHLWNYVLDRTRFLDTVKTNEATRVYYCLNHVEDVPECSLEGCHNKMSIVLATSLEDPSLKQPKYCSKKCARKAAHEATIRCWQKKYGKDITNVFQVEEIKEKANKTRLDHFGVISPLQNRSVWLKTRKKYTYDGMKFDSSWEIVYYAYLKQHEIPFEYQPKADFSYAANGTNHNYYPDFFLPNENVYVEIKDERSIKKYLEENDASVLGKAGVAMQEKLKLLQRLVAEGKVLLLTSVEMEPYFKWFRERYGVRYKEYLRQFKNK